METMDVLGRMVNSRATAPFMDAANRLMQGELAQPIWEQKYLGMPDASTGFEASVQWIQ